ncbi:MAG: T9SS type A sorting domain-containing protein [Gemmatimonadetes bacterium]|nr:T9SS type A sorting domain-containing protein [Gemmatimonadota bacterium]
MMKQLFRITPFAIFALLIFGASAYAQAPREDAVWARTTDGAAITLDGVLDEAAWAEAESLTVQWGQSAGIPGSGWKAEVGFLPVDPTYATIKFLVDGNQLYLGFTVSDSSVGGGPDFNRFDGFLMAIKNHEDTLVAPKPPGEYFYSWWYDACPDSMDPGKDPGFIGVWGNFPPCTTRSAEQIANWDAVTIVKGLSNDDAVIDTGYVTEMRIDVSAIGYDMTQPEGDIIEWNCSIYDADWFWPINATKVSGNRTWIQGPWGNQPIYNQVRIYSRPDVTINSGAAPDLEPELRIPNGALFAAPTIDGVLDEALWDVVPGIDIRFNDDSLRASYPGVSAHRAGQYQPDVNGGAAVNILDPGDCTIQLAHIADTLYIGFDFKDQYVQSHPNFDRWDGFIVNIIVRDSIGVDSNLVGVRLTAQVNTDGTALPQSFVNADYLPYLIDSLGGASVAMAMNAGTTVDTLGLSPDNGYTAELAVDLTKLGYPKGLGDRTIFLGVNILDGDSFAALPPGDSYGTRTWWYKEYEGTCCPAWGYLDPALFDVGVDSPVLPTSPSRIDNYPNPYKHSTTLRYSLRIRSEVTLEVFDVAGRRVDKQNLGRQAPGIRTFVYRGADLSAGTYFYRLSVPSGKAGDVLESSTGKMTILR